MPNLIKYESTTRLICSSYKTSDIIHGVYRVIGVDNTGGLNYIYPYGSWINWFGAEWDIGGAGVVNTPIIDYVGSMGYSFDITAATNTITGVDTTYFNNSLHQLNLRNSKSIYYYKFASTTNTNLTMYISGLCKSNANGPLILSYAYSIDGTNTFNKYLPHNGSAKLTTGWTPFIYKTAMNFGNVAEVRLVPIVWSGTYLYGPIIKDLTIMLISDNLI